jgi:hypothetical protein
MAGVLVTPGQYQIRVEYFNSFGKKVAQRNPSKIEVKAGEKVFLGARMVNSSE